MFLVMTNPVTFFRSIADPTRWRIVRLVMERALCVCELADILEMPQSSVSSHVQVIRKAGLLESETCGKWTYFRISKAHLPILKAALKQFPDSDQQQQDARRATERMSHRESTCCPGPKKLSKPRKLVTKN